MIAKDAIRSSSSIFISSWLAARMPSGVAGRISGRQSRPASSNSWVAMPFWISWPTPLPTQCWTTWSSGPTTGPASTVCPRCSTAAGCVRRDPCTSFVPMARCHKRWRSRLAIPPELGPVADVLSELRDRVRTIETDQAAERLRTGRRVLGRRAALGQSWHDRPTSYEPRRNLRPRVATPNKWARMETVMRNRAFVEEYADAHARWRGGGEAVFPPGTYWLQRFASVLVLEA